MNEYTVPSLLFFTTQNCFFADGQTCDFSHMPRPFFIISRVRRGCSVFEGKSQTVHLKQGDVFFIPMGETYVSHFDGDGSCESIFFSFEPSCDPLKNYRFALQKIQLQNSKQTAKLFDFIFKYKAVDGFSHFKLARKFYTLCDTVFPLLSHSENTVDAFVIKNAVAYINAHYSETIAVKQLAQLCSMSESAFFRCFKQIMGETPITYKNRVAVSFAMQLLQYDRDKSIEEISSLCGFATSEYFRRVFRKVTGKSPKQCRGLGGL